MRIDAAAPRSSWATTLVSKLAASRFITASIALHTLIILLLGSVVLFQSTQKKSFEVAYSESGFLSETAGDEATNNLPPAEAMEFEEPLPSAVANAVPLEASAIVSVSSTSSFSVGTVNAEYSQGNAFGSASMGTAVSDSAAPAPSSSGRGSGRGTLSGNLFGVPIQTRKLGVILDISGSAQPFLLKTYQAVDSQFQGMPIVLYPGCGALPEVRKEDITFRSIEAAEAEYKQNERNKDSVFGQVAIARDRHKDFDRFIRRVTKEPNVYWSIPAPGVKGISGVQHAFAFLESQGVDTIYWFSDVQDNFNKEIAEKLGRSLGSKQIKVIVHNFGKQERAWGSAAADILVQATGGTLLWKTP